MGLEAFYLPAHDGSQRFCLHHVPADGRARSAIVYVHPFAEEMNKSRRMAALQSRAFAAAGHAVLQVDLLGCGDSSGEFGDATWAQWVQDVVHACRWMQSRWQAPLVIWGLRAGCLLAAEAAGEMEDAPPPGLQLLCWQPTPSGRQQLQQFLRLKIAADLAGGRAKGAMEALRDELAAGRAVDIAGYRLSPGLAAGLELATLRPSTAVERLRWLEVSPQAQETPSPASANAIAAWEQAGCRPEWRSVAGPAFWQTVEIEDAPALVDATLAAFDEVAA